MKHYLLILLLGFLLAEVKGAQDTTRVAGALFPDRPGVGESAYLVTKRNSQSEWGFGYIGTVGPASRNYTYTLPNLLIKYGLLKKAELRFKTDYLLSADFDERELFNEKPVYGFNFVSLGTKLELLAEDHFLPQVSLLLMCDLKNTGSKGFKLPTSQPTFKLLSEKGFGEKVAVCLNFGFTKDLPEEEWRGVDALSASYQFSETIGLFAETYGSWIDFTRYNGIDAGIFWKVNSMLQLDFSGGLGEEGGWGHTFVDGGISIRNF